jgi:hypothetical protein
MKVIHGSNGSKELLIMPETDFESEYIKSFQNQNLGCFVKTGIDLTDIIGLRVFIKGDQSENNNH